MNPIAVVEAVINTEFGGFSLNTEMALWLMENRNWKITKQWDCKEPKHLVESIGDHYYVNDEKIDFRLNKDLIDCVRALKEVHKNDTYPESYYGHIHNLKIVKLKVNLSIENYHDGKERIGIYTEEEIEYEDD